MIAKELQFRFRHYAALVVALSSLCALYIFANDLPVRMVTAALIGLCYFGWGMWTHQRELKTTRLVLEYVAVGMLGSVILILLAKTV